VPSCLLLLSLCGRAAVFVVVFVVVRALMAACAVDDDGQLLLLYVCHAVVCHLVVIVVLRTMDIMWMHTLALHSYEPVVSALSCHLVVVVVIRSLMLVLVLTAQLFVDYRDNGERDGSCVRCRAVVPFCCSCCAADFLSMSSVKHGSMES
jgi:hypothetical protein